ncbi:MAG TPA: hypothetical protein VK147_13695 [Candidatus Didemnitutus sp.]|nr:hypothetical protein [Candidatus Didemnitutus sp.]
MKARILLHCVSLILTVEASAQTGRMESHSGDVSAESELVPGRVLTYHLRVDQSVVKDKGVCIPAVYQLEVLDRDAAGNVRVGVHVRTMRELLTSDTLFASKSGELKIVGFRMAWISPKYEATLDKFGRLLRARDELPGDDEAARTMGSVLSRTTDYEAVSTVAVTFPTELALLAPYQHGVFITEVGKEYVDTLTIRSSMQAIGQTFGPDSTASVEEIHDMIIRRVRVDSLSGEGPDQIAYIKVVMNRSSSHGAESIVQATMERYVSRGYMKSFKTTNNLVTNKGLRLDYVATTVLERSWVKNTLDDTK